MITTWDHGRSLPLTKEDRAMERLAKNIKRNPSKVWLFTRELTDREQAILAELRPNQIMDVSFDDEANISRITYT